MKRVSRILQLKLKSRALQPRLQSAVNSGHFQVLWLTNAFNQCIKTCSSYGDWDWTIPMMITVNPRQRSKIRVNDYPTPASFWPWLPVWCYQSITVWSDIGKGPTCKLECAQPYNKTHTNLTSHNAHTAVYPSIYVTLISNRGRGWHAWQEIKALMTNLLGAGCRYAGYHSGKSHHDSGTRSSPSCWHMFAGSHHSPLHTHPHLFREAKERMRVWCLHHSIYTTERHQSI